MDGSVLSSEIFRQKQIIEMSRMQAFMKRADIPTETVSIHPISELGYVVNPKTPDGSLQNTNRTLVLFDFDDVVYRTTEGVYGLMDKVKAYAETKHLSLTDEQATKLVRSTESFCSWKDGDPNKEIAHPTAQLLSLEYLLSRVATTSPEEGLTTGIQTLERIKRQQLGEQTYVEGDPFRFNARGTLTKLGDKHLWSKELEEAFQESFFGSLPVKETIDAIDSLRSQGMELGIFTTGDPAAQLLRINEVLGAKGKLPIPHIWLAKGDKGQFISTMVEQKQSFVSSREMQPSVSSFDAIIMFDDNPSVLDALDQANGKKDMPTIVGVRYRLPGGYAEQKPWTPQGLNQEITDPTSMSPDGFMTFLSNIQQQLKQQNKV